MKPTIKPKRTAEQRAEEEAIRRQHTENPVDQPPASTLNQQSFATILTLLARLKSLRTSQGLTLEEVAKRMGIDVPALSRLETGKTLNPTLATLQKWADALGQNLEVELLGIAEDEHKALFSHFGLAAFLGQQLETTLSIILIGSARLDGTATTSQEIDDLETDLEKPLGKLIERVRNAVSVPGHTSQLLNVAVKKRNYLVHRFFRERAFHFTTPEGRHLILGELREIQAIIYSANKLARELLEAFRLAFRITPEELEAELREMR